MRNRILLFAAGAGLVAVIVGSIAVWTRFAPKESLSPSCTAAAGDFDFRKAYFDWTPVLTAASVESALAPLVKSVTGSRHIGTAEAWKLITQNLNLTSLRPSTELKPWVSPNDPGVVVYTRMSVQTITTPDVVLATMLVGQRVAFVVVTTGNSMSYLRNWLERVAKRMVGLKAGDIVALQDHMIGRAYAIVG